MEPQKIGQFIIELRKENQMSQEELAQLIPISRQAISKWENGRTCPDNASLSKLSEIFKVEINELLSGKRLNKKNYNDITLNLYNKNNKNKTRLKWLVIVILIIFLIFLLYYFFNLYNAVKVYIISGNNKNIDVSNGILVTTHEKIYFRLGEIKNINEKKIKGLAIYYITDNNKKVDICSCDNCQSLDVLLVDYPEYNIYFDYDNTDYITKNMKLKVIYDDNSTDLINLLLEQDFTNRLFARKKVSATLDATDYYKSSNTYNYEELINHIKSNLTKIDDGYFAEDKNINMIYLDNNFIIDKKNENSEEYWTLNFQTNILTYEEYTDEELSNNVIINLKNEECLSENCNNIKMITENFVKIIKSNFK